MPGREDAEPLHCREPETWYGRPATTSSTSVASNRLRYVKNPETGKRISRLNPKAKWITKEIPSLRIVSDELWNAAKDRQTALGVRSCAPATSRFARRPQHLFSGLSKCLFVVVGDANSHAYHANSHAYQWWLAVIGALPGTHAPLR